MCREISYKSDFRYYYFFSEYKGTNKEFYEAIQSYTPSTYTSSSRYYSLKLDYSVKDVYGKYGCEKEQKMWGKCDEASNEVVCVFNSSLCV